MPIETPRAARGVLAALLAPLALLVLASVPLALDHKDTEYLVARELDRSGLPLFDSAALAALVQKVSDHDTAASAPDGSRGLLLLDARTARRHGLRIAEERPAAPRTIYRRMMAPAPTEEAISADERLDAAAHLRAAVAHYRETPRLGPSQAGSAIAALQRYVLSQPQAALLSRLLADQEPSSRLEGEAPLEQLAALTEYIAGAPLHSDDARLRDRVVNHLVTFRTQIDLFSRKLPKMRARLEPTPVEYVNSLKDILAQVLALQKWALHLLLGGWLFFIVLALSVLAGAPSGTAARASAVSVLAVAVAVELIDWRDAVLNGKETTLASSIFDIVVTCVVPLVVLTWYRTSAGQRWASES
jgi:hypothetical protein